MLKLFKNRGEAPYDRAVRLYLEEGAEFSYWEYPWEEWPDMFCNLVTPEKALGHCPRCGSSQQLGSRDSFPETYRCGHCGFNGPHPLYGQDP